MSVCDYFGAEVVEISSRSSNIDSAAVFCALLDELREEQIADPARAGFFGNRVKLMRAYDEHRMYGLRVPWSEELFKNGDLDNPILLGKLGGCGHRMMPCFLVLEAESDGGPSICTYLWTGKRARMNGLAKELLEFFDVRSAEDPLPEADEFWTTYFASVEHAIQEDALDAVEEDV
jgi:hypothetical protein